MTRARSILVAVGTLGAVAMLWIVSHRRTSEETPPAARSTVETTTGDGPSRESVERSTLVAAQLAELTAEVSNLRGRLASREAREAARDAAPSPEQIEDSEEESRLKWQEHMAQVEEKFKRERVDPSWARDTSQLIERELASEPSLRTSLRSMECRAQSCRLELNEPSAPGADGSEHALPLLIHRLGTALPVSQSALVDAGDGKSVRVVFLLKESES
ncbi:MAG: hypothetical protein QM784_38225 [Polyangiaceae bacterium]